MYSITAFQLADGSVVFWCASLEGSVTRYLGEFSLFISYLMLSLQIYFRSFLSLSWFLVPFYYSSLLLQAVSAFPGLIPLVSTFRRVGTVCVIFIFRLLLR